MRQIWAPWRKKYVRSRRKTGGCLFCRVLRAPRKKDFKNLLLLRSKHSFLMLNLYPYTNGHLMAVPNRHVPSLEKLNEGEKLDLLRLQDRALGLLRRALHPQGFNLGINLGKVAGAGIPRHVHIHIVPRWFGDTNFMPVLSGAKVIADSPQGTYQALSRFLKKRRK